MSETQSPPRRVGSRLYAIYSGLLTTAIALYAAYLLAGLGSDYQVMWFYYHIIPVGAIGLGVVAGVGYAFGSWFAGVRPSKPMLATIALIQIGSFFAAAYLEFRQFDLVYTDTGEPVRFGDYFHARTLATRWVNEDGQADKLGEAGYFILAFQVAGFAGGGLVPLLAIGGSSYCQHCGRYRRQRDLAVIPASVPVDGIDPDDEQALEIVGDQQEQARASAQQRFTELVQLAIDGDVEAFRQQLRDLANGKSQAMKLPCRMQMHIDYCPECHTGGLYTSVVLNTGDTLQYEPLPTIDLKAPFVAQFTSKK